MIDVNFQRISGRIVATLTRILGARHLALAEEAAQDAFVKALQLWPHEGVPANPSAWLIQVAKNRALDLLRRDQRLTELDAQRPAGELADQRAFELTSADYAARLDSVLDVLYLLFNEGYAAHSGDDLVRAELCREAVRLGELLAAAGARISAAGAPAVHALLALMYLQAPRLPARVDDASGDVLLRLAEQDRARWDAAAIARGMQHLDAAASGDALTVYHLEAGIAACHAAASRYDATDWANIVDLYDALIAIKSTPVVALNRAIAVSRLRGPAAGLAVVDAIAGDPLLARYYLLHATVGELALECGDRERAAESFNAALACECSQPERRCLERRLQHVAG